MEWEHPDEPETRALIERSKAMPEDIQRRVWEEMQLYRARALAAAAVGENLIEREIFVAVERGRFKMRLEELLKEPPASC